MKLSEFAHRYGISDRHARRIFEKSMSDLTGHYERKGNVGTFLDDYAVSYLRDLLRQSVALSPEAEQSDREKALDEQLKVALARYAALAEQLVDAERRAGQNAAAAALLEASKENVARLEAGAKAAEERATQATADLEQAKDTIEAIRREAKMRCDQAQEAEERAVRAEEAAKTAEDIAQIAAQEAEQAKAETAELQKKLDGLKKRSLWSRIWNKEE